MDDNAKGIIPIIIGIIFIVFPMFSADLISIFVGLMVLICGCGLLFSGYVTRETSGSLAWINIILGIILIILGLCFIFAINAVSFLVALQFYIVGFILILVGITGLLGEGIMSKTGSLLNLVLGIVVIFIAIYAANSPQLITIILGIVLIANGILSLINNN